MNLRWKFVTWFTIQATEISGYVLKERLWPYQLNDYQNMSQSTLGHKYFRAIIDNTFEYKANLVRHDMKHIILGYDMSIKNELNIVAFLIGNRSANKVAVFYLILCLMVVPDYIPKLTKHYERGKSANRIKDFELTSFVEIDINETRRILNLK